MANEQKLTHEIREGERLAPILEHNIESLVRRRERDKRAGGVQQRIADTITAFTGSMTFVYVHLLAFTFWIAANLSLIPFVPPFDETFVVLAMVASVEAIFLSTFVLISQNRMAGEADRRADLDLQVSLLTEHELTNLAKLVAQIAERLQISPDAKNDMDEVTKPIAAEAVLDRIEATKS